MAELGLVAEEKIIVRHSLESVQIIVESLDLPITAEGYLKEKNEIVPGRIAECKLMPGVEKLTQLLAQEGIPQAMATSSDKDTLEAKIIHHREWFSLFQTIVTGDDPEVSEGKPAPDIFLVAAKRLGFPPKNCLAFEDAPTGTQAANSAGMAVIAIPAEFAACVPLGASSNTRQIFGGKPNLFAAT